MVTCILDSIHFEGFFFNLHLYPQAYLMDAWTNWGLLDTAIILVHMEDDMSSVLKAVSGSPLIHHERKSGNDQIGIDELDPALVARICELYAVDVVLLQRYLGFDDPYCDVNTSVADYKKRSTNFFLRS